MELEHATGLNFPGIKKTLKDDRVIKKFKNWLNLVKIDFETVTWKKYIDFILAFNLDKTVDPKSIRSKYEIYLAVMKITVDKIGVGYEEIGIEKSFTSDLGIDWATQIQISFLVTTNKINGNYYLSASKSIACTQRPFTSLP